MKRRLLTLTVCVFAFTLSFSLFGCAKTISGSVDTVVQEAQELSADETANVEVTGEISSFNSPVAKDSGQMLMFYSSNNSSFGNSVALYFDSLSEDDVDKLTSGRVTITGELIPSFTSTDSIALQHCKVK